MVSHTSKLALLTMRNVLALSRRRVNELARQFQPLHEPLSFLPNLARTAFKHGAGPARLAADALADLMMPPLCVACHQPLTQHDSLCARCWSDISFITAPLCDRLGIPLPFDPGGGRPISAAAAADPPTYDRARAAMHFSGVARDLIHRFKYGDQQTPRRLFNRFLAGAARDIAGECDVVVPVPLHSHRLFQRRFNQSAILAADLSRDFDLAYEPMLLLRQKPTRPQVGLTRDQRRRNLQGAFKLSDTDESFIFGRNVLLIDDVITTGTTIDACARVLKRAGAQRGNVAALAMVTDDSRINP